MDPMTAMYDAAMALVERKVVTCSIADCERPAKTKGWCLHHYDRWRRYGNPEHECEGRALRLAGKRFGRLTVMRQAESSLGVTLWNVRCDCGTELIRRGASLTGGHTRSCGCLSVDTSTTHGMSKSPEFKARQMMIQRCTNPKHPKFKHWGGRGITICPRWLESFENFFADMGPRPSDRHSIDRYPDNDGNYEPSNCRWATYSQQNENRRSNGLLGKPSAKKGKRYARTA